MNEEYYEKVRTDAACLAGVELGLGSFLHAFHIPLAGHFLALNQGFFLTRSVRHAGSGAHYAKLPLSISTTAAVFKAFSPVGKILTPMLAIVGQGFFFSAGVYLFGVNVAGIILGMTLLAAWTFLQPILMYYLFFGPAFLGTLETLLRSVSGYLHLPPPSILQFFIFFLFVYALAAWIVGLIGLFCPDTRVEAYKQALSRIQLRQRKPGAGNSFLLGFRDLARPYFIAPLLLVLAAAHWQGRSFHEISWIALRSLIIAYSFFVMGRLLDKALRARSQGAKA